MAATLLWMVIEKAVGLHGPLIDQHAIYTNIFAIPAILMYVLALRDKRSNFYEGRMTWVEGFLTGLKMTLVVVVLSPIGQYITHTMITPDYFNNAIAYAVESGALTEEAASDYFNLQSYMLQSMIGAAVMGLITGAIVAIFVKKK